MAFAIGMLFIENVAALAIGIVYGLTGWFYKFIKNPKIRIYCKLAHCIVAAMFFVIVEYHAKTSDAKYLGALSFGYVSYRVWGEDKPSKELAWFWFFI